jgi:hypothetical protein
MMRSKTKMWLSLGTVSTLAAVATVSGAADAPAESPFSVALKELFSGEGGQSTLGTVSSGPTVSFKAMTQDELKLALTGNTLRRDRTFAWFFEPGGKLTGWQGNLAPGKVDESNCKQTDPDYTMSAPETCRKVVYTPIEGGSWSIKGNEICTKPTFVRVAGSECISLFLVADKVVGTRLDTLGKPNDLAKGKQLEYLRK